MTDPDAGPEESAEIRLIGFPVAVYVKAQQHSDELVREFELIAQAARDHPGANHDIPGRLLALIEELNAVYSAASADGEAQISAAVSAGQDHIDQVVFMLPRHVGEAARHLGELLDQADSYCRAGRHLLTLATPTEQKRFRDWYLGEFIRQSAGQAPIAWPDYPQG